MRAFEIEVPDEAPCDAVFDGSVAASVPVYAADSTIIDPVVFQIVVMVCTPDGGLRRPHTSIREVSTDSPSIFVIADAPQRIEVMAPLVLFIANQTRPSVALADVLPLEKVFGDSESLDRVDGSPTVSKAMAIFL